MKSPHPKRNTLQTVGRNFDFFFYKENRRLEFNIITFRLLMCVEVSMSALRASSSDANRTRASPIGLSAPFLRMRMPSSHNRHLLNKRFFFCSLRKKKKKYMTR